MPYKDRETKLAYQRAWYAANREKVIASVNRRKWELYGGTCRNCGAPTQGTTKGVPPPEFCSKPGCRSVQRNPLFVIKRKKAARSGPIVWKHDLTIFKNRRAWQGVCVCGWESKRHMDKSRVREAHAKHARVVEKKPKRPATDP